MPIRNVKPPYHRTRTKTLGVRAPRAVAITIEPPAVCGSPTVTPVVVPAKVSLETCHDVVTPGFQQLAAEGVIVNNPFSKVSTLFTRAGDSGFEARRTDSQGTHKWYCDKDLAAITWGDQAAIGLQRISQDNLVKLAQTQALAGVQAPTFEGLVALAELRETLNFLLKPKRALLALFQKSVKNYRSDLKRYGNRINSAMKKRTHAQRAKAISEIKRQKDVPPPPPTEKIEFIPDLVLAYNLGWRPLLMDVDAILNKVPALEFQERRTSRANKSDSVKWSEIKVLTHSSGNVGTFRFDYEEDLVVRAGVMYADGFDCAQHFGYRLADLPGAAWEALPFSFLADYAVNVGDYINSLRVAGSRNMQAYFTKVSITTRVTRTWVSFAVPAPWSVTRHPAGSDVVEYEAVLRWPDPFSGQLAHTPLFDATYRPPAQLQNVLSLLTNLLVDVRKSA